MEPKAAPYLEPVGAYSQLTAKREGDNKLSTKDLLSFARQIAAGMVQMHVHMCPCIHEV